LTKYHFRKETTEKTGTITNDDDGADQNEEQEEPNVIHLSPCIPVSTATTNSVISPSISILGTPSIPSTPANLSTLSSPTKNFKSPNSIQDQLASMAKQLSKITNAIENIHLEKTSKESSQSSSSRQADDIEQLFESIKCSNDLFMLDSLEINNHLDTITCILCST